MYRLLISALVTGVAIAGAPAMAGVPDPEYGGKIDGKRGRYIGFDITRQGGDRKLRNMFVVNVPFHGCDDPADDGKQGGEFEGKFVVGANGRFKDTKTDQFRRRGTPTGITYTLDGRLDGDAAEGTLKMKILGTNCRSGEVDWKARKPAPPVPET